VACDAEHRTALLMGHPHHPVPLWRKIMTSITYRHADVDGFKVFYREAGEPGAPKLLLLHGFPSSSHMFRDLIPKLADRFHIIAPDLPGFGQSDMPSRDSFTYTFDNIANVIERFTEVVGFDRFAVYVFDYGAPRFPARRPTSRADHCDHFAERQRLRRRLERRLESDPGLLERRFARESRSAAGAPHARDNRLAIHARRVRHGVRFA